MPALTEDYDSDAEQLSRRSSRAVSDILSDSAAAHATRAPPNPSARLALEAATRQEMAFRIFADQTWTQLAAANARSDRYMQTVMQRLDDSSLEMTRLANTWQASSAPSAPQRTQQVPTVSSSPTIAVAAPLPNNLFATSANGDISLIANTDLTHSNLSRTSTLNTSLVSASHEEAPHIISLLPLRPDSSVHRSQPLQLKPFDPKGNFQTWRNNAEFKMKHEGYTTQSRQRVSAE